MPIQATQWTDYLNCPMCTREFAPPSRCPISLGCGHTLCRDCLRTVINKPCPFDQTVVPFGPEDVVVNTALLQLLGYTPPSQPYHPPCIAKLSDADQQAYDVIIRCMEHLSVFLKFCGNVTHNVGGRLSRPMQRKLVTLLQCCVLDEDGRGRAARAARSLGERTVTELILQHQNPQQLSANLWAAVRARGCQFLGPAMQEEVLKLVLLALEDGSALSRKVLVMFVVQRLEPHFPQASKTSIGHVVQLLYRASCFKVSKRECDSSLMQLKDEFRTYELLRREHDAQIVQIATEAGLRIAPDQWSALLYGDTQHKSHMQSIIDKLQSPQSFAQSVQELFIALQRTGDPAHVVVMSIHLDRLAGIDSSPDAKSPTWQQLAEIMSSLKEVVSGLIHYLQQQPARDANHNQKHPDRSTEPSTSQPSTQTAASALTHNKYKVLMCRDAAARSFCPRGGACTFAHSEEELERYRSMPTNLNNCSQSNGNYVPAYLPAPLPAAPLPLPQPVFPRFPLQHPLDNYNVTQMPTIGPHLPPDMIQPEFSQPPDGVESIPNANFPAPLIHSQAALTINHNGIMLPMADRQFYRFSNIMPMHDDASLAYPPTVYQGPSAQVVYASQDSLAPPLPNMFVPVPHDASRNISPYSFDDLQSELLPDYRTKPYAPAGVTGVTGGGVTRERWPPDVFSFNHIRDALPPMPNNADDMFHVGGERRVMPGERIASAGAGGAVDIVNRADDQKLEEELQALERRIDTEFKSTD